MLDARNKCRFGLMLVVECVERANLFRTSDFRLQTSDFRLQASDFRFQISDFRFQISELARSAPSSL
jgi:hypothetical protein